MHPDVLVTGQQGPGVEGRPHAGDEGGRASQPSAHLSQLTLPVTDGRRVRWGGTEDERVGPHRGGHRVDLRSEGPGLLDAAQPADALARLEHRRVVAVDEGHPDAASGRRGGVDFMVAMNPQTWDRDVASIEPGGYLFYDSTRPMPASKFRTDITVIGMPLTEICNAVYSDPRQRQLFKNIIYVGALSVLLDIDHTPHHLLHPDHAPFYSVDGLQRLRAHLRPGGVFAMWSDDPPDADFCALLEQVFDEVEAHVVAFDNFLTGGVSSNTVYVAV